MAILQDNAALLAQLQKLQAENEALKAKANNSGPFRLKVSEKGALSAYGLGRFPVTLYKGQWQRLLTPDRIKEILDECETNPMLKGKDD